jgi:hypothetical protein
VVTSNLSERDGCNAYLGQASPFGADRHLDKADLLAQDVDALGSRKALQKLDSDGRNRWGG